MSPLRAIGLTFSILMASACDKKSTIATYSLPKAEAPPAESSLDVRPEAPKVEEVTPEIVDPPIFTRSFEGPVDTIAERPLTLDLSAIHPNKNVQISYRCPVAPEGVEISQNGVFTWKPTKAQIKEEPWDISCLASVADVAATIKFQLLVFPRIKPIDPIEINENESLTLYLPLLSIDSSALVFNVVKGPEELIIDEDGQIQWTPGFDDAGNHGITIQLTEPEGTTEYSFSILVNDAPEPKREQPTAPPASVQPPIEPPASPPGPKEVPVAPSLEGTPNALLGLPFSFTPTIKGSMPEGTTYSLVTDVSGLLIDDITGTVTGPVIDTTATFLFEIVATRADLEQGRWAFNASINSDPLFAMSWHLENTGQNAYALFDGTAGYDLRLTEAYKLGLTGEGVKIVVSDTGLQQDHPDLKDNVIVGESINYDPSADESQQTNTTPTMTAGDSGDHGTSVAGIIAAKGWNNIGSRGVAPNAKLIGKNYLSYANTVNKLDQITGDADIFNQSFGLDVSSVSGTNAQVDSTYEALLISQIETGRTGKGPIYVKAAGNEFNSGYNANCDPNNNIPWIMVVTGYNADGKKASYASTGSSVWLTAPSGEYGFDQAPGNFASKPAIITTDLTDSSTEGNQSCQWGYARSADHGVSNSFQEFNAGGSIDNPRCDYTSAFNGTSAATPNTSGVVALLLERNPNLTWRDVKHILAKTAYKIDDAIAPDEVQINLQNFTREAAWTENAAGYWFHNWYGFGAIDASAAILLADPTTYTPLPELEVLDWQAKDHSASPLAIPDETAHGATSTITVTDDIKIETVQIRLNISHTYTGDLGFDLVSPSGTTSILLNTQHSYNFTGYVDLVLLSNQFYGESSQGDWTLKITDGWADDTGTLSKWEIKFTGHKESVE